MSTDGRNMSRAKIRSAVMDRDEDELIEEILNSSPPKEVEYCLYCGYSGGHGVACPEIKYEECGYES